MNAHVKKPRAARKTASAAPSQIFLTIDRLAPKPGNPRSIINEDKRESLGESLIERGQIYPILVRPISVPNPDYPNADYEYFAGYRRVDAFRCNIDSGKQPIDQLIDCKNYPDADDDHCLLYAMAENMAREEMSPMDECEGVANLLAKKIPMADLVRSLGRDRAEILRRAKAAELNPDEKELVAMKKRSIAWGARLATLNEEQRRRVMDTIQVNPDMYMSEKTLIDFANAAKIPVSVAIFDVASSGLAIQQDLLEAIDPVFACSDDFWIHQRAAAQSLVEDLERQGHKCVTLLDGAPFPSWDYDPVDSPLRAHAFVELTSKGEVVIHAQLRKKGELSESEQDRAFFENAPTYLDADVQTGSPDPSQPWLAPAATIATTAAAPDAAFLAPPNTITTKPPEKAPAAYLAKVRLDIAINAIASDDRLANEYLLAGLLGDTRADFGHFPTEIPIEIKTTESENVSALRTQWKKAVEDAKNPSPLDYVTNLNDDEINALIRIGVALKLANQRGGNLAFVENAAPKHILARANIDIRASWTPSQDFLDLIPLQQMRDFAGELLTGQDAVTATTSSRKDLVAMMNQRFNEANKPQSTLPPDVTYTFRTWLPDYL